MGPDQQPHLHPALPHDVAIDENGALLLGGCNVRELAATFGTPLYVYDRATILSCARQAVAAMGQAGAVHYAAKAYQARWLLDFLAAEGLGLDVSSGAELGVALAAGFPAARIRLHGNNKQPAAIRQALEVGIGAVVVDGLLELELVIGEAERLGTPVPILLRLNPGIEAHTHRYLQTGVADSKFGLSIADGAAAHAVDMARRHQQSIRLLGYHAHIGTQILDLQPYRLLMQALIAFARRMDEAHGFWPEQLSPGGGIGIAYTDETPPALAAWIAALRDELSAIADRPIPLLGVEPGRALVGPAGVAIYRVGMIKVIAGGRTCVAVDGGMADNIRPALYDARYAALAATRMCDHATGTVTVVGPYCESGDILVRDAPLPFVTQGDLIALPAAGAYCLPMSSNYNGALRPAVVTVASGAARLVQRRQELTDLLSLDVTS